MCDIQAVCERGDELQLKESWNVQSNRKGETWKKVKEEAWTMRKCGGYF